MNRFEYITERYVSTTRYLISSWLILPRRELL